MKKRILAMALAIMMLVMIPAETAMAMPAAFNHDAAVITLAEESAEEAVVEDETTPEENEETTETEEVVEEPTAEPEMTEEPTEEPVATEEPTEEATEEPVVEPEATEEPTEAPAEEPEVTEEPTVEATEEPVVEPEATEEPTEEATEEPTEEPTETPEVTLPEKQDVKFDGRDLTAKVVGSDGVQYDNVEYLSLQAVNTLSSEGVAEYIKMCDDIASLQKSTEGIENAVFALDKNGDLTVSVNIPTNMLFSEEIRGQFIQGFTEDIMEEPEEVIEEAPVVEEVTEEADEEIVSDDVEVFVSENVELLQANAIPEVIVGVAEDVENDTKMANANYFKNQLDGNEKSIWSSAYNQMVKGGKNSFTHRAGYVSWYSFMDAISAVNLTYPNSFNWMQSGGTTNMSGRWSSGKYNYSITIEKSTWYNKGLETQANAKVKELVAAAEASANKSYAGNHVYGMIRYFDNWIRQNNYYNNVGTDRTKTKTEPYFYCHSCYGILFKGYGVCESYALAMTRLLDAAGIRNVYVTGYAGGGHAWNYVQMPNGKWYMLDTTWNDGSSSDAYFLIGSNADGGEHQARGNMYTYGSYFKFYALDKNNYVANTEKNYLNKVTLNKSVVGMKPGATLQLKITKPSTSNYYYSKYAKSWSSSNTNVAKVSSTGKVTAVAPGSANITYTIDGLKKTCTVYVYQFMGNKFTDNNKTSYTYTYLSADTAFDSKDVFKKNITVTQKSATHSAAQLQAVAGLKIKAPTVKSSNTKIATATAVLSGNTIVLTVTPKKVGTATITVSFAGKTSTLKLTNKYNIATNAGWFDYSKIVNQTYKGTAYKPAVKKTATAPANLKYTVSYKNNINAGTATVTIKGTGNYAGTITKNFTIAPKNLTTCKFTASTKYKTYNGKAQKAVTTVKDGKTTLKAGTNYVVQYYVNKAWTTTAPTNVGTYSVRIVGSGNYTGTITAPNTYEIKQIPLSKVTISCPKEVKWKSGKPVTPPVKVKIGSNTLTAGTDFTIGYYKITKNSAGAEVRTAVSASALCDKGNYVAVITKTKNSVNINWGTKLTVEKKFTIKKM